MNKKRLLGGVTWLATISALVLWFPIIALGVLKLKDFITDSTFYQTLFTLMPNEMNSYKPVAENQTTYAIIASAKDWMMMFSTLALTIILWYVKIKSNKKVKQ